MTMVLPGTAVGLFLDHGEAEKAVAIPGKHGAMGKGSPFV
jgi:hypothetical protein